MKKIITKILLAFNLFFFIFLNSSNANAQGELNLYNWGDYINPAVLEKFEAETGIKVNLDVYGSNEEMLAKIQAGATGYDIVFPSVHFHDILFKLDLLHESKINEHPSFGNIDKEFIIAKTDPNSSWCLPYARGSVGIFYNKNVVKDGIKNWEDFLEVIETHFHGERREKLLTMYGELEDRASMAPIAALPAAAWRKLSLSPPQSTLLVSDILGCIGRMTVSKGLVYRCDTLWPGLVADVKPPAVMLLIYS